ncbi:hypothetical protein Ancab_002034 [Ancistrocladus abbreviatus]
MGIYKKTKELHLSSEDLLVGASRDTHGLEHNREPFRYHVELLQDAPQIYCGPFLRSSIKNFHKIIEEFPTRALQKDRGAPCRSFT